MPTRRFTPPPMPFVPFMPQANIGPQDIALGEPPAPAPPPAPPPRATGAPASYPDPRAGLPGWGAPTGGMLTNPHTTPYGSPLPGQTPWQNVPGPVPMPKFGDGYKTPMQLWQEQQQPITQAKKFDGPLANLGLGILNNGFSMEQMMPQIMQMYGRK